MPRSNPLLSLTLLSLGLMLWLPSRATAALAAAFTDEGCTLSNDHLQVALTAEGDIASLRYDGGPNLVERGYLTGPYLRDRSRATGRLVRNTPDVVEVAYAFTASHLDIDLHYVLLPDAPGLYLFMELKHAPRGPGTRDELGFFKQVIKADPALFDLLQSTDTQQGPMPPANAIARTIGNPSDHTYELSRSRFNNAYCTDYYSKYDYMQYGREHGVYGLYSSRLKLGLYVVNASEEWLPGGPTKNFQTVHDPAIINSIINDQHMLPSFRQDAAFSETKPWSKLAGPFLVAVRPAPDASAAWAAAKDLARSEAAAWPYPWMRHPDYPLERARVEGTFTVHGASAANAWCVLADPATDWQTQCLGYIYWTRADASGHFVFPHVRPGTYAVYAYGGSSEHPRRDNAFNEFRSSAFEVGTTPVTLPDTQLVWNAETFGRLLFQIGIPDRSTREFHLGSLRRQYHLWAQVPKTLDYHALPPDAPDAELAANDAQNWDYLESADGSAWRIHFSAPQASAKDEVAWLTLSIVGACKSPELSVTVNGTSVVDARNFPQIPALHFGDDASVRRCAVNGGFHRLVVIPFRASLLHAGPDNVLTLGVHIPGRNPDAGGIMYDALKLEVGPARPVRR